MDNIVRIPRHDLEEMSRSALETAGVPAADARIASEILVLADMQGIDTHGTRRLGPYVESIRNGTMKPRPDIRVARKTPALAMVDGDDGLGPVVGHRALSEAMVMARDNGIAYVGARNSNHFAAIAPYATYACAEGLVCFIGSNAFSTMAPWRGRDIKHGNNPLCVAAPRRGHPPFIIDIAMSVVARGRMRKHMVLGESIPAGWAMDPEGKPTTDPRRGLMGFPIPIGEHKGYGLAMAIDILAGALTGGCLGTEVKSLFQQKDEPQKVSHFFILIDPAQLIGLEAFFDRMEDLCAMMKSAAAFDPDLPVLIPGEPEAIAFAERTKSGIPMDGEWYETVRTLAHGSDSVTVPDY